MVKTAFEGLSLSMRFVLPAMFALGWYCYQGDMHRLQDGVSDIKTAQTQNVADFKQSQAKIWDTLNNFKDDSNKQFNYLYQRIR